MYTMPNFIGFFYVSFIFLDIYPTQLQLFNESGKINVDILRSWLYFERDADNSSLFCSNRQEIVWETEMNR